MWHEMRDIIEITNFKKKNLRKKKKLNNKLYSKERQIKQKKHNNNQGYIYLFILYTLDNNVPHGASNSSRSPRYRSHGEYRSR